MPLNREQIKHAPVSQEVWRQPRTSTLWFDPRHIRPLGDHILVELVPEARREFDWGILRPEITYNQEIGTRFGTVLAVGPGKWKEDRSGWKEPIPSWILLPLIFKPTTLKPGDRVAIGHYSDWESWNCSADGYESRDANIVLCQEGDVRVVINTRRQSSPCNEEQLPVR